jgi:hypothetical protein
LPRVGLVEHRDQRRPVPVLFAQRGQAQLERIDLAGGRGRVACARRVLAAVPPARRADPRLSKIKIGSRTRDALEDSFSDAILMVTLRNGAV